MEKKKQLISPWKILIYVVVGLSAIICVLPVLNMVAISFSDSSAAAAGMVYFWPVRFTLSSYRYMLEEGSFFQAFKVSVIRVLVNTLLSMSITILMAYPLSKEKKDFRFRNGFIWYAVVTMLFSGGLIPTYMVVKETGLIDSFWSLILPGLVNVYNMILLMNFFRGVPRELDEAATIDGARPLAILWKIYLPVSLPALATIGLFTIVGAWNDYFTGLIYLNTASKYPLQTYIRQLVVKVDYSSFTTPEVMAERMKISGITFNAAKIVVSMVPVLCIYPFLQKYFVTGLVMGSVKE